MNDYSTFVTTLVSARRRNEKISLIRFFTGMILGPVDEFQSNIDIAKQNEKKRFIINVSGIRSLETSADIYVDFCAANLVKHGMDCFPVHFRRPAIVSFVSHHRCPYTCCWFS